MSVKISKFLSLVLRHAPEKIGLKLDQNGWVEVNELLQKSNLAGTQITTTDLSYLVFNSEKKRFVFNDDRSKIRAAQGHSVAVDLNLKTQVPPDELYHGTATRFLDRILNEGLNSGNRQHVHLSQDQETALTVGARHGKPVVIRIQTKALLENGQKFWLAENGVWLTGPIPAKFLTVIDHA